MEGPVPRGPLAPCNPHPDSWGRGQTPAALRRPVPPSAGWGQTALPHAGAQSTSEGITRGAWKLLEGSAQSLYRKAGVGRRLGKGAESALLQFTLSFWRVPEGSWWFESLGDWKTGFSSLKPCFPIPGVSLAELVSPFVKPGAGFPSASFVCECGKIYMTKPTILLFLKCTVTLSTFTAL